MAENVSDTSPMGESEPNRTSGTDPFRPLLAAARNYLRAVEQAKSQIDAAGGDPRVWKDRTAVSLAARHLSCEMSPLFATHVVDHGLCDGTLLGTRVLDAVHMLRDAYRDIQVEIGNWGRPDLAEKNRRWFEEHPDNGPPWPRRLFESLPKLRFAVERLGQVVEGVWQAGGVEPNGKARGGEGNDRNQPGGRLTGEARKKAWNGLRPCDRQAYLAFQYAEQLAERQLQDHEAHEWLNENGIDTDKGELGELADYGLPSFETFAKYLRTARNALNEQKYSRRAGRTGGGSVVRGDEIEFQGEKDG